MVDLRDTDPDLSKGDPTWLGPDYPAKSPAELAAEDATPRVRVRIFADRWGKVWLLVPVGLGALYGLFKLIFH